MSGMMGYGLNLQRQGVNGLVSAGNRETQRNLTNEQITASDNAFRDRQDEEDLQSIFSTVGSAAGLMYKVF